MADDTGIPPFHQEAVSFILANISRLPDDYMECVKTVDETFMRTFENEIHNINTACQKGSQCSRKLFSAIVTGSSAEGLHIDNILHYPSTFPAEQGCMEDTDLDCMYVDRRFIAAEKLDEEMNPYPPVRLKLQTTKHKPGYCSLIIDEQICNAVVPDDPQDDEKAFFTHFMKEHEGKWHLSSELYSAQLQKRVTSIRQEANDVYKHGPAITTVEEESFSLNIISDPQKRQTAEFTSALGFDIVPAIQLEHWPEISAGWQSRKRQWPEQEVVEEIMKTKCHLVPVSHRFSSCPAIEWRLSFSLAEKGLALRLTMLQRQFYTFFKHLLWRDFINKGRIVSSYHLKTAFFWLMEDLPTSFWKEENFSRIASLLTEKLLLFLLESNFPNYFVPSNNMISHLKAEDLQEITINLKEVKKDILLQVVSSSGGTLPVVLEDCIFKRVFSSILPFMQMDKDYFNDGGVWDTTVESSDDEWSSDDMEEQGSFGSSNESMESEDDERAKSGQNKRPSSSEYKKMERGKNDKAEAITKKRKEKGRSEREENRKETEEHEGGEETLRKVQNQGNQKFDEKDQVSANQEEMNEGANVIGRTSREDRNENKEVDTKLLSKFNKAKMKSLLKLARLYQMFESFDFTVQILTEIYQKREEDELTLTSFITEVSLKDVTAEMEPLQNIIQLHEFLLSSTFPDNASIKLTLAYLHLCLASVSNGADKTKELETAVSHLDAINESASLESDVLRARIEAAYGRYESARDIMANCYLIMKESGECGYVSIHPVEYNLFPESLSNVIASFAYGTGCPTNVLVNTYILFLKGYYQSQSGMKKEYRITCEEFNEQLSLGETDGEDQELGQAMYNILLSLGKD